MNKTITFSNDEVDYITSAIESEFNEYGCTFTDIEKNLYDGLLKKLDNKDEFKVNFDTYQAGAKETAIYPGNGLVYTALGLNGEAGEVAEHVKKMIRDDQGQLTDERKGKLEKELGDVLWYLAMVCHEAGLSLSGVAEKNLAKLAARKENNLLQGSGSDR